MSTELDPKDIRISTYTPPGSSRGGWAHPAAPGVTIVHLPTGLEVSEHEDRSQFRNRVRALERLTALVAAQHNPKAMRAERPHVVSGAPFNNLKELRMWHWRQVVALRAEADGYEACAHTAHRARRMHEAANLHLRWVQVLNDHLPGTAEQDCAESDNG